MTMLDDDRQKRIADLLRGAKALAYEYYDLTKKPLGVTGEIAELVVAEKLGLTLAEARTPFYDASRENAGAVERFQIKGRAVSASDPYRGRVPSIKYDGEFDAVLLVLLNKETLDPIEILQAPRERVKIRLQEGVSKARNERNSMAISQFRSIAKKVWPAFV
jgi:hypothetical protein